MQAASISLAVSASSLSLLLAIHLATLNERALHAPMTLATIFLLISAQAALLAALVGTGMTIIVPIRVLIAALMIPLFYLLFAKDPFTRAKLASHNAIHIFPLLLVTASWISGLQAAFDPILVATEVVYLVLLARLWLDGLRDPFLATSIWFLSALILLDGVLALELAFGRELPATMSLAFAAASLGILGAYAIFGALGRTPLFETLLETAEVRVAQGHQEPPSEDDRRLAALIVAELGKFEVIGDEALNLQRLARRLGQPQRRVSQAINRVHRMNVSDFINIHRIARARSLIDQAPATEILDVMASAGYSSKSNFYKQFKRHVGCTPGAYARLRRN